MSEDTPATLLAPLDSFTENMKELDALRAIYSYVSVDNPLSDSEGNPYNIEIMIKSSIVFIVTCWDEFIRELLTKSFDFMINNVNHDSFSTNVKMRASEKILPSELSKREKWHYDRWKEDIWKLAGDGWRSILKDNKDEFLNGFNTPRPDIIDKLFLNVIGLKKLSSNWKWKDMTEKNSKDCLNILMNLRGDIVHRNRPHRNVTIDDVEYFSLFVKKLAGISANIVRRFVYEKTTEYPWDENNFLSFYKYNEERCK